MQPIQGKEMERPKTGGLRKGMQEIPTRTPGHIITPPGHHIYRRIFFSLDWTALSLSNHPS